MSGHMHEPRIFVSCYDESIPYALAVCDGCRLVAKVSGLRQERSKAGASTQWQVAEPWRDPTEVEVGVLKAMGEI